MPDYIYMYVCGLDQKLSYGLRYYSDNLLTPITKGVILFLMLSLILSEANARAY